MSSRNYWTTRLHGSEFKVMRLQERPVDLPTGETPELIALYLGAELPKSPLYNPDVETMMIVLLNTRRKIMGWQAISTGTLDTLLVHPREIFKPACIMNASAIVLAHNHPSGDPTPSEADIKVTRDMIRAGQLMKIELLDHVILGASTPDRPKGWISLRELGYFYS